MMLMLMMSMSRGSLRVWHLVLGVGGLVLLLISGRLSHALRRRFDDTSNAVENNSALYAGCQSTRMRLHFRNEDP